MTNYIDLMYDDAEKTKIQGVMISNPRTVKLIDRLLALHKISRPACYWCNTQSEEIGPSLIDGDPANQLLTNLAFSCRSCSEERSGITGLQVVRIDIVSSILTFVEVFVKRPADQNGVIINFNESRSITESVRTLVQTKGLKLDYTTSVMLWKILSEKVLVKGLTRIDVVQGDDRLIFQDVAYLLWMHNQISSRSPSNIITQIPQEVQSSIIQPR